MPKALQPLTEKQEVSRIDLFFKTIRNIFDTFTYVFAVIGLVWFVNHAEDLMKLLTK